MKICNDCKTVLDDRAIYCPRCGTTRFSEFKTITCKYCHKDIAIGTIVCPHCHKILPPEGKIQEKENNDALSAYSEEAEMKKNAKKDISELILPSGQSNSKNTAIRTKPSASEADKVATEKVERILQNFEAKRDNEEKSRNNTEKPSVIADEKPMGQTKNSLEEELGTERERLRARTPRQTPKEEAEKVLFDNRDDRTYKMAYGDEREPYSRLKTDKEEPRERAETEDLRAQREYLARMERMAQEGAMTPQMTEKRIEPIASGGPTYIYNQFFPNAVSPQPFVGTPQISSVTVEKTERPTFERNEKETLRKEVIRETKSVRKERVKGKSAAQAIISLFILTLIIISLVAMLFLPTINWEGSPTNGIQLVSTFLGEGAQEKFPSVYIEAVTNSTLKADKVVLLKMVRYFVVAIFGSLVLCFLTTLFSRRSKGSKVFAVLVLIINILLIAACGGILIFLFNLITTGVALYITMGAMILSMILTLVLKTKDRYKND